MAAKAKKERGEDEQAVQMARFQKAMSFFADKARDLLDMPEPTGKLIDEDVDFVLAFLGWSYCYYEEDHTAQGGYDETDALAALGLLNAVVARVRERILCGEQPDKDGVLEETIIKVR